MRRKQGRGQFQKKAQCRGGETGRRGGIKELGAILKRCDPKKEARPPSGAITRYFEGRQFPQGGMDSRPPSGHMDSRPPQKGGMDSRLQPEGMDSPPPQKGGMDSPLPEGGMDSRLPPQSTDNRKTPGGMDNSIPKGGMDSRPPTEDMESRLPVDKGGMDSRPPQEGIDVRKKSIPWRCILRGRHRLSAGHGGSGTHSRPPSPENPTHRLR